jgi:Tfp pilus assembly protein PilF
VLRKIFALPLACFVLASIDILGGCSSIPENRNIAEMHLKIGVGHMSAGNYPLALAEILKASNLDPDNPVIENNLGLAYALRGRLDLSEIHIRRALSLKPEYTDARNNLGRILLERGNYKESEVELIKVTEDLTYGNPEKAFTNMGIVKFKMEKYEEAKRFLQKSLDLQRENCVALSYYGRCYYELQDYKKSAEVLDKAVGYCMRIQYDEPHYYGALSYFQNGEKKQAETRLEQLIKLYPDGKYSDKARAALEMIRK